MKMHRQLSFWNHPDLPESASRNVISSGGVQHFSWPDADIAFYPSAFNPPDSDRLFAALHNTIDWQQESLTIYGKTIPLPRLTAWYADPGKSYTYSGITMRPQPWTAPLLEIKATIEDLSGISFNSVLLNLYRTGQDSMAWHSDDEPELGQNPIIASVSFGATRRFALKHKFKRELKHSIDLTHGSFLLMQGTTQQFWRHQIPKTTKPIGARINLTFRVIN